MCQFLKRQILHNIPSGKGDLSQALNDILKELNVRLEEACSNGISLLQIYLATLRTKRNIKLKEVCRIKDKLEKQNESWLNSEFNVPNLEITDENRKSVGTSKPTGRPTLTFQEKSDRSKRREASNISRNLNHDPQMILQSCRHAANM